MDILFDIVYDASDDEESGLVDSRRESKGFRSSILAVMERRFIEDRLGGWPSIFNSIKGHWERNLT